MGWGRVGSPPPYPQRDPPVSPERSEAFSIPATPNWEDTRGTWSVVGPKEVEGVVPSGAGDKSFSGWIWVGLGLSSEPGKQNRGRGGFQLRAGLAGVAGRLEGCILRDAWPGVGEGGELAQCLAGPARLTPVKVPWVTGSQCLGCIGKSRGCQYKGLGVK